VAKTLLQLNAQIEKLQQQAGLLQSKVVTEIKKQIKQYGLTVDHLFGAMTGKPQTAAAVKKRAAGTGRSPKFADDNGNTWGGMGKRPAWIRDALEAGRSLDEFLIASKAAGKKVRMKPQSGTASAETIRTSRKLSIQEKPKAPAAAKTRNIKADAARKRAAARTEAPSPKSRKPAAKRTRPLKTSTSSAASGQASE
jgi:DNA-binding protein H-NS